MRWGEGPPICREGNGAAVNYGFGRCWTPALGCRSFLLWLSLPPFPGHRGNKDLPSRSVRNSRFRWHMLREGKGPSERFDRVFANKQAAPKGSIALWCDISQSMPQKSGAHAF